MKNLKIPALPIALAIISLVFLVMMFAHSRTAAETVEEEHVTLTCDDMQEQLITDDRWFSCPNGIGTILCPEGARSCKIAEVISNSAGLVELRRVVLKAGQTEPISNKLDKFYLEKEAR